MIPVIHAPGSSAAELLEFDIHWFMGAWSVIWSTLPMWQDKKDVTITYTPKEGTTTSFASDVAYRPRTSSASKSHVRGVETLAKANNKATFDWRGNGLLWLITSHWEVIGLGRWEGYEWVVTCGFSLVAGLMPAFSKTLFTPAGLDLYVRALDDAPVNEAARKDIIEHVVAAVLEVAEVRELAKGGFPVP